MSLSFRWARIWEPVSATGNRNLSLETQRIVMLSAAKDLLFFGNRDVVDGPREKQVLQPQRTGLQDDNYCLRTIAECPNDRCLGKLSDIGPEASGTLGSSAALATPMM